MNQILAVDVGQTGMRASWGDVVLRDDGGVLALTDGSRIRALVDRVVRITGETESHPNVIALGLSGFVEGSPASADLAAQLLSRLGVRAVAVAADAVTAHLGTVGVRAGTTVICGTGAAALGSDGEKNWRRIDGRGYLLGDFGSGFWIGQRGLQAALNGVEGRGAPTTLSDAARRLGSPEEIYHRVMGAPQPSKNIAAFAPDVLAAAEDGDEVALDIVTQAAEHIVRSADAAKIADGPLGLAGGLLRSAVFVQTIRSVIDARFDTVDVVLNADAGLKGARVLGESRAEVLSAFPGLVVVMEASSE